MGFQGQTDYFGYATDDTDLEVVSSKRTPRGLSTADAENEKGDIEARSYYGSTDIYDIEVEYALKGGSIVLNTLKLGKLDTTMIVTGIDGTTSNKDWPTITAKGVETSLTITDVQTYTLPAVTITGKKLAQAIGVTIDAGCKLTGSNFSASVSLAECAPAGTTLALDVSGGEISGTNELVSVTDVCAVTVVAGWTITQEPGADESGTAYGTGSASVNKVISADVQA